MVHLSLIAHVERHHKNSGLHLSISTIMFTRVQFLQINDFILKFVMIAWLVVLAKKDSGTTRPFSLCIVSFQVVIKALFQTFYYF